ncbi:unnamed protein product [Strongylus vulgaris]|uniref:Uncharacterized protein n=1 Tax=Strongylus vulgaris TaxID=40348 RepID=A0A3P7KN08_STRVU|nr:unnamed protein product [Strongylus vulgaris]
MARIGYGTSLNWYTVERLIKKHISDHGVPTYIYYFAKPHRLLPLPSPQQTPLPAKRANSSPNGFSKRPRKAKDPGDLSVQDEDVTDEEEEESESSSGSSSESEHDWSEEDEEDEEDSSEDDISSSDEEIEDEELEELEGEGMTRRQLREGGSSKSRKRSR